MNLPPHYPEIFVINQNDLDPSKSIVADSNIIFPAYSKAAYKKKVDLSDLIIRDPSRTYFVKLQNDPFPKNKTETGIYYGNRRRRKAFIRPISTSYSRRKVCY